MEIGSATNQQTDVSHFVSFFPQLFLFTADYSLPFPLLKVKMPNQFFLWPCLSPSLLQNSDSRQFVTNSHRCGELERSN
jgi:hypothetical protein